MTEKAIRDKGLLWAYEPEASSLSLIPGSSWLVYRDTEQGGRLRVGLLKAIYAEEGTYVVAYDEYEDIELRLSDIVSPARRISNRGQLKR